MRTDEYWAQRFEQLNAAQLAKGEAYISTMRQEYAKAMSSIRRDVNVFYQRFARNNEVSFAEARHMLKADELKEFKWSVEEYIKRGRENAVDRRWMKELENASIKVRMSRLQALQMQMRQQVELLSAKHHTSTRGLLGGIHKDNYHRSIFELQKGVGVGASFSRLDTRQIDSVLVKPWAPDGKNFSARIWGDKVKLINELQTTLTHGLIRGDTSESMISALTERMGVSRSNAERLILTESAYFAGQSRLEAYKEMDVEQYKYMATLDKRTSDRCRTMDGRVFTLAEATAGVNYPPLHARCRSTTIPHFVDNVKERAARDDEGKSFPVPGDMTYNDWEKQHAIGEVGEPPLADFNRKFNPKASFHADLPNVSEPVREKLAEVNRNLARQGAKESKETMVLVDHIKGTELGRHSGTINKVAFSTEMHSQLMKGQVNSIVLTHNHPRGTRVDVKDIKNFALYPSLSHIIAVGHDGGISYVASNGKILDIVIFNALMARVSKKVAEDLQKSKIYAKMSVTAKHEYFDYLVTVGIVNEMGWTYGEEFEESRTNRWFG